MTIDGIERKFLFDTGSSASLIINEKDTVKKQYESDVAFDGAIFMSIGGYMHSADTSYIKSKCAYFSSEDSIYLNNVVYSSTIESNNAGMEFISKFDWIMDGPNKSIYAKPIIDNEYTPLNGIKKDYVAGVQNEQLIIVFRNLSKQPVYPLYAVIKSVDGIEITQDNICNYFEILNNADSWDMLDIEHTVDVSSKLKRKNKK